MEKNIEWKHDKADSHKENQKFCELQAPLRWLRIYRHIVDVVGHFDSTFSSNAQKLKCQVEESGQWNFIQTKIAGKVKDNG